MTKRYAMNLRARTLHTSLLLFFLALCGGAAAQRLVPDSLTTNTGRDFWFSFVKNGSEQNTYEALLTFTALDEAATVTLESFYGALRTLTLAPGESDTIVMANGGVYDLHVDFLGFHITATAPVHALASWSKLASTGATTLLPYDALDTRYRVIDYPTDGGRVADGSGASFVAVTTERNTPIHFTPPVDVLIDGILQHAANVPYSVTIGTAPDARSVHSQVAGGSLSGMEVSSSKPFALFQGNRLCGIPHSTPSGDYVYEQAVPVSCWGQQFAAVPTGTRSVGDVVRIVADEPCTVSVSGSNQSVSLAAGDVHEIEIGANRPCVISASAPVGAALFSKGSDWMAEPGDAAMVVLTPMERAISHAVFKPIRTERIASLWSVTLVTDSPATMTLDGNSIAQQFHPIDATGYYYAQIPVNYNSHVVANTDGTFVGWTNGIGNVDSYIYSLGYRYKDMSAPEMHYDTTIVRDTVCLGEEYSLAAGGNENFIHVSSTATAVAGRIDKWACWEENDTLSHCIRLMLTVLPTLTRNEARLLIAGDTLRFADTLITLAGDYTFRRPAPNGCDSVVTLHVDYEPVGMTASAEGLCPGEELTLTATGTHTFRWSAQPPDPEIDALQGQNPIVVHPQQTTTYSLIDEAGTAIGSITVGVEEAPTLCIESPHQYIDFDLPGLTLTDCSEGRHSTAWDFSDGTHLGGRRTQHYFAHPLPDTVSVAMTSCNRYGCCADTTVYFPVEVHSVWFPNIFFPSAEENNRFGCTTSMEVADFELYVYNRWGLIVWNTTDIGEAWDGTHQGTPVAQGAYVYRWVLTDRRGEHRDGIGTVTLIR